MHFLGKSAQKQDEKEKVCKKQDEKEKVCKMGGG